jgi:hypothetical protein
VNHGMRQGQNWGRGDRTRTSDRAGPLAVGLILWVVVAFGAAACPYDDDLVLENLTIDGSETFGACLTITAGPGVTVSATGAATFQAGERIVLRPGFRVQPGGRLIARIALSAGSGPLNDTGIDWCANQNTNYLPCPVSSHPSQDGDHGRDAQALAGTLSKVGGGNAGFDFTKIANDGSMLPATATLGSDPNDWACTRDNVTGLIWEVKTASGLRSQNNTYTWYDPNSPDGNPGTANGGTCTGGACDTTGFVQAVNAQGLCGAGDWRLPTVKELEGIVDYGRFNPAIDPEYFPNTPSSFTNTLLGAFWSGSSCANDSSYAWSVIFLLGHPYHYSRSNDYRVRLVRGGP